MQDAGVAKGVSLLSLPGAWPLVALDSGRLHSWAWRESAAAHGLLGAGALFLAYLVLFLRLEAEVRVLAVPDSES